MNARTVAFKALVKIEKDNSYSNIVIDSIIKNNNIDKKEASFATMLFYGVLERKITLDYIISQFSKTNIRKMQIEILTILRLGIYQIMYADKIPNSATVNECVNLAKKNRLMSASSFINAVLRSVIREKENIIYPKSNNISEYLSIKYSCPINIVELWLSSYGEDITEGILSVLCGRADISAKINNTKTNIEFIQKSLKEKDIFVSEFSGLENAIFIENTGSITDLDEYKQGLLHIQDISSQICCKILNPQSNDIVIDVCSAPGGKSFTIAELMNNKGKVISMDLYASRLHLVESGAKRLGLDIIETICNDATKEIENENFPMCDRLLCDVPCSGLGIIRRKPELRYKNDLGVETLPDIQYKILNNYSKLVKKNGIVVYSTCTLNPKENGMVADRFLKENKDFLPFTIDLPKGIIRGIEEPCNQLTLFPHLNKTDGFFISVFIRNS